MIKKKLIFLLICSLVLLSCGYSAYKRENLPFKEITIGKIDNKTSEPGLQDRLHRKLVDAFIQYGFEIKPLSKYRVDGEITKFQIKTISEKHLLTTEYQIIILCNFKLTDVETGKTIEINNVTDPFVNYFLSTGKLEHILARKDIVIDDSLKELSREIVRSVIDRGIFK
ncbi:MAG: LPS assembly lipoprotein LptE [Thermodesulfovibrionales bacterium]|nr:LPS assembly lipoprotein LptE [Thermodesulfovibrionales bacterium]